MHKPSQIDTNKFLAYLKQGCIKVASNNTTIILACFLLSTTSNHKVEAEVQKISKLKSGLRYALWG